MKIQEQIIKNGLYWLSPLIGITLLFVYILLVEGTDAILFASKDSYSGYGRALVAIYTMVLTNLCMSYLFLLAMCCSRYWKWVTIVPIFGVLLSFVYILLIAPEEFYSNLFLLLFTFPPILILILPIVSLIPLRMNMLYPELEYKNKTNRFIDSCYCGLQKYGQIITFSFFWLCTACNYYFHREQALRISQMWQIIYDVIIVLAALGAVWAWVPMKRKWKIYGLYCVLVILFIIGTQLWLTPYKIGVFPGIFFR